MKHIAIIAISTIIAHAAPVFSQTLMYEGETVKAECSAEWGTEYDMVKYCVDQRNKGFATFQLTINALPDETRADMSDTIEMCEREWQQEWDMTSYCLNQNMQAASKFVKLIDGIPKDIGMDIARNCIIEWGADMTMVAYCTQQRVDGWRSLNE